MPKSVLVLQHAPWERPGLIARVLAETVPDLRLATRVVLTEQDAELPHPRDLAGVVVLGGPMNADDDERFPGLAAERRLLAAAVDAELPVLGVCLGMQLLARALGAQVHPDHGVEIGFAPLDVVTTDAVLAPLGDRPTVLHWHADAADLPVGATLLASTPATPVQAFRAGSALGLQFHIEVDEPLIADWLAAAPVAADLATHGITDLRAQAEARLPDLVPRAVVGLRTWAEGLANRP